VKTEIGQSTLELVEGDITQMQTEAIVNAAIEWVKAARTKS